MSVENKGVAKLKPEFIVTDHVRQLNLEFIAGKDKSNLTGGSENSASGDPPNKKFKAHHKKLKGQNKKRPREIRTPKNEKLCLKFLTDSGCLYGAKCCFSHDIPAFAAKKLPDIGKDCYMFDTYGKCPYNFLCRFSSAHISPEFANVVDEDRWALFKDKFNLQVTNTMSKNVQVSLWKRRYDFQKSHEILETIKKSRVPCNEAATADVKLKELVFVKFKHEPAAEKSNCAPKESLLTDCDDVPLKARERKKIDFRDKLYLAPLTTVGNLPFRRICKEFGADITCGEMAMSANLLQGQQSEWALLKRHHTEDIYGVQVCGSNADIMTRSAQLLNENVDVDFVDINMGCPIDFIYQKGMGCGLMNRVKMFEEILYGMTAVLDVPLTVKLRTGLLESKNLAHKVINKIHEFKDPVGLITLHGRSREQRYTKAANWDYITECRIAADPIPFYGCGDVLSYDDANFFKEKSGVSGIMLARGALIKPWIFTEIKEQRHWDISSSERFEILKRYTNYGFEHWGSDTEGVEKTRRFLLEWLSFLYRYIPVGLLENPPQRINERPPSYRGRDDLETLMASPSCADWVKISEMLLGPVPEHFSFLPKHKANAYQ